MTCTTATDATLPMRSGRWSWLIPGVRADRYRLTEILGTGAMGVVFRAHDPTLQRDVALKSLHVQDAHTRQRFIHEARAMARLSHPNVVQVFDVVRAERRGEEPQCLLAMELVEGQTLERWLATPRSWSEIRDAFVAAGRGLAAAHGAGLVHRDFKPANVIVGCDGRVRVTDFGLSVSADERAATLEDEPEDATASLSRPLGTAITCPGVVVGTPAYMAPEQHRGAPLGPAADQFAFCAALFEALFDERPFDGRSCRELSQQKHAGAHRPARGARPVPSWLRRAVLRGLHPDPSRRFSSMLELLAALGGPAVQRRSLRSVRLGVLLSLLGSGLGLVATSGAQAGAGAAASSAHEGGR